MWRSIESAALLLVLLHYQCVKTHGSPELRVQASAFEAASQDESDCQVGDWIYYECDEDGFQLRRRPITVQPRGDGAECPRTIETIPCNAASNWTDIKATAKTELADEQAAKALYCSDPWMQCGGSGYIGPLCCVSGYKCTYTNSFYSQCLPAKAKTELADERHANADAKTVGAYTCSNPRYAQCGGKGWTGQTCCSAGNKCVYNNDWYSQCLPATAKTDLADEHVDKAKTELADEQAAKALYCSDPWMQCGGSGYIGPLCCVSGYKCTYTNSFYSQCLPATAKTELADEQVAKAKTDEQSGKALYCSSPYMQCGGSGYIGPLCCVSGYKCTYTNSFYSQCLPATAKTELADEQSLSANAQKVNADVFSAAA